jgi:hypothetical protein
MTADTAADHETLSGRVDARLEAVRSSRSTRRIALVAAVAVGVGLSLLHWVGLVAGGALVGITRRRLRTAILAGVAFGLVAAGGTVLLAGPELIDAVRPVSYLSVAVGVLLSAWGSLARYVL